MPKYIDYDVADDGTTFSIYYYPDDKLVLSMSNKYNSVWEIDGYTKQEVYSCRSCRAEYTVINGLYRMSRRPETMVSKSLPEPPSTLFPETSVPDVEETPEPIVSKPKGVTEKWNNICPYCKGTRFWHNYKFPEVDMMVVSLRRNGVKKTFGKIDTETTFLRFNTPMGMLLLQSMGKIQVVKRTGFSTPTPANEEEKEKTFTPLGEVSDEIADMLKKTNRNIKRAESIRSYRETQPKQTFGLGTEGKNKLDNVFDFTITNLGIQKGTRLYNNLKTAYNIEISNALINKEYVTKKREDVTNEMVLRVIDWIMEYVYFNKNIKY